jgi:hypothetical protein
MRERSLSVGLIAVIVATAAAPLMAALPPARQMAFAILSGDDPIGHHSVTFERRGEDLAVDMTPDGLWVEGAEGGFLAPKEIIPTSYWNPATIEQTRLLDTQRGGLMEVSIQPFGKDAMATGSAVVPLRKYAITGDLNLDVWYSEQGEWAKIAFEARGTTIDYAPVDAWAQRLGSSN